MIIETLLSVGLDLFGIISKLDEKKIARNARLGDYFSSLAQVIEETSASLKKGDYPHGQCAQLSRHAEQMKDAIGSVVKDVDKYAAKVREVWEIEQLYGELSPLTEKERAEKLKKLDEAAGHFRAIAALTKVST